MFGLLIDLAGMLNQLSLNRLTFHLNVEIDHDITHRFHINS